MSHWYDKDGNLCVPGVGYPSPTTILDIRKNPGLDAWRDRMGAEAADAHKQARAEVGSRVHEAIEFYILDGLGDDMAVYCEEDIDYVRGFLNWMIDYAPTNLKPEVFVRSHMYEYAGTADLICWIKQPDDAEAYQYVVDFKTSKRIDGTFGLQLAAYENAWEEMTKGYSRRAILQLVPSLVKGYRFKEYRDPYDYRIFLAHKQIFDWLQQMKPIPKPQPAQWLG